MNVPTPQLLSWPLDGISNGRFTHARDDVSIQEVILNILLTRPGERLMRPTFGAGLLEFVHEPNNATTRHLIADLARKSIEQWEPRVVVDRVEALADDDDPSVARLSIAYRLRHDPRQRQLTLSLNLGQVT